MKFTFLMDIGSKQTAQLDDYMLYNTEHDIGFASLIAPSIVKAAELTTLAIERLQDMKEHGETERGKRAGADNPTGAYQPKQTAPAEKTPEEIKESMQEIKRFFDQNKTMKMIGKTSLYSYVIPGGEASEDFENVISAYSNKKNADFREIYISLFALGFLWGQKKERQRKKQKAVR